MASKTKRAAVASPAVERLAGELAVRRGRRRVALGAEAIGTLATFVAYKSTPDRLDATRLAPAGSVLARVLRHFEQTDIPAALPLFSTVMLAASWLTQNGAALEIPGVGRVRPTLWTVALAESGAAKTLAAERIARIFAQPDGSPPVAMLRPASTAAQWILDLDEQNGAYWFQDEVGKYFRSILTESKLAQIKPWLLDAYSHQPIANRIKGDKHKLVVNDPHFTFFGLSVFSTWPSDIDAASALDGMCQRFNYVVAQGDPAKSMFDNYLFFADDGVEAREAELSTIWQALCAQPAAASVYRLDGQVLDYLRDWWSDLRHEWGAATIPGSYIRRIGFSVLRYLIVLHFLLGKARRPIDVETARLATRYAEHHLEAAAQVLASYDEPALNGVAAVSRIRERLRVDGENTSARSVMRRLSQKQRLTLDAATVKAISAMLDGIETRRDDQPFPKSSTGPRERGEVLIARHTDIEQRLLLSERKRNERRIRELRRLFESHAAGVADAATASGASATVVVFPNTSPQVWPKGNRRSSAASSA